MDQPAKALKKSVNVDFFRHRLALVIKAASNKTGTHISLNELFHEQ